MAHQMSAVIGYLDVQECGVHDVVLSQCSFKAGCAECGRQMDFGVITSTYTCMDTYPDACILKLLNPFPCLF